MQEPIGRPDFDQALKRLLLRAHEGFLALVAPGVTWRGELSPELPAVARQADLVWEVENSDGRRGLLHVELQTKADETTLRLLVAHLSTATIEQVRARLGLS